MAETYISQGTNLGTTGNTEIYDGVVGTAIVNSINISNIDGAKSSYVDVYLVKGITSFSIISDAEVPPGTALQVLDAPIICESGNTLTATADSAGDLDIIVSALEIT